MNLLPFDEYVASLPLKRMSAGVLLHDDAGRVVLVEPSYKPTWDIPGGVVDAGESPWHAAARELAEELGIVRRHMRLLVIDHTPARSDTMPEGIAWIFDGGPVRDRDLAALSLDDPEVVSVGLYRPDEVAARTSDRLARRLAAALAAVRDDAGLVLCDDGVPTTA
jgi:ADP-ribose pyrophosphatase YjhB (NUDIX family)